MYYLAHISEDKLRQERIQEHLQNVADTAACFAAGFHGESWGYCCGMMHDIGKYSREFFQRLHGGPPVDHSTAGAKELMNMKGYYSLAAYCVAGHHAGLPDFGSEADDSNSASLSGRLRKKLPDYMDYKKEIVIPPLNRPEIKLLGKGGFSVSFFLRMVYSCLVDADFLETEKFMLNGNTNRKPDCISKELLERLMKFITPWLKNTNRNTVNGRRTEILKHCLEYGKEKQDREIPCVFQLTVPTGGGKTIASLAFALQHSCTNKKKRIIYVIPYTSIIEQNADVFRNILGDEYVLENHSHVQYDDKEEFRQMQLAAENWDKPIVVTTNVQFFESLFSNKSSHCRKLHNIANSVIIFDEAQMLPVSYLKPCVRAMTELAVNYQSTIILCTATQPSLQKFFPEDVSVRELCPAPQEQFDFFKRTSIEYRGTISEDFLIQELHVQKQALCILNSRKKVQAIYQKIKKEGFYHLTTMMYPVHRKRKLKELRSRLKLGKKCIVIATSLVEAGVDLDFQCVYREIAGVDSMVQAAGRCNREGIRPLSESKTYIFQFEERTPIPSELKQSANIGKYIAETFSDVSSPEAIQNYFQQLHYLKGEQLDKKEIIERLENSARTGHYTFASIASDVRLIEENTQMIFVEKEEVAKKIAARLRCGERSRTLMQEAGNYSIQVYEQDFEKLRAAGYLEELDHEIALLKNLEKYTDDMGLMMDVEFGEAVFLG